MSLFYKSNEAKERKYQKENRLREINDEAQQEIVDDQIAEELGLEKQATNLGKLAKRVINKIGADLLTDQQVETKKQLSAMDILTEAIKNKKLTELFQSIKKIPNNVLTEKQIYEKDLLKTPEVKQKINDEISAVIEKKGMPTATDITKIAKKSGISFMEELTKKAKERADRLEATPLDMSESKSTSKKKSPFQEELDAKLALKNEGKPWKATKTRTLSDDSTEKGTLAGEKMDARALNTGRPPNDINSELNKFSDLLIKFDKSKGVVRADINKNLNNILSRIKQVDPKMADRMKSLKSALHKK